MTYKAAVTMIELEYSPFPLFVYSALLIYTSSCLSFKLLYYLPLFRISQHLEEPVNQIPLSNYAYKLSVLHNREPPYPFSYIITYAFVTAVSGVHVTTGLLITELSGESSASFP